MKKQYTRKQIVEAIAYWKKQLRAGNYKKLNESKEDYEAKIREAYEYAKSKNLCNNLEYIETPVDNTVKSVNSRNEVIQEHELYILKYADGTERWMEKMLINPRYLDGIVHDAHAAQIYRKNYKITDTVKLSAEELESGSAD